MLLFLNKAETFLMNRPINESTAQILPCFFNSILVVLFERKIALQSSGFGVCYYYTRCFVLKFHSGHAEEI